MTSTLFKMIRYCKTVIDCIAITNTWSHILRLPYLHSSFLHRYMPPEAKPIDPITDVFDVTIFAVQVGVRTIVKPPTALQIKSTVFAFTVVIIPIWC